MPGWSLSELDPAAAVLVVHPDARTTAARRAPGSWSRTTTMYWPSAVQAGCDTRTSGSVNTSRGLEPSASITQRLFCPFRSETKAMSLPSGEIRGWVLIAMPEFCVRLRRRAALDRHAVDVREQVEHQPLAVGRHVDRHPGALGGGEADLARLAARLGDIPLGALVQPEATSTGRASRVSFRVQVGTAI